MYLIGEGSKVTLLAGGPKIVRNSKMHKLLYRSSKEYITNTQCAGGGGLEKVPILKQLLHFSGQSVGGGW